MTDQVRLAFIGCGNIVASHLNQGLKDFEDVDFVGWCDLNRSAAESRRAQANGRGEVFDDAAAMLDTVAPDAVFVAISADFTDDLSMGEGEALKAVRCVAFRSK